jgi:hypothetical protein
MLVCVCVLLLLCVDSEERSNANKPGVFALSCGLKSHTRAFQGGGGVHTHRTPRRQTNPLQGFLAMPFCLPFCSPLNTGGLLTPSLLLSPSHIFLGQRWRREGGGEAKEENKKDD